MKPLVKHYINPPIKKALESLMVTMPLYEIGLDIGLSETSLRAFLKGRGLKEENYRKVENFFRERNEV